MKNIVRIGITLVGLIIGGISYWFQPYEQLNLSEGFITKTWFLGAFFGSLLLMIFLNEKLPKIALLVFLGVVLAVLARIIYDTDLAEEYGSHNFAPFELIYCGIITIPSAFAGAYLGLRIKKLK